MYNSLIKYFGLRPLENDILTYYTGDKTYVLRNNYIYYNCSEDEEFKDSKKTMLKKFIRREFIIKKILE
jgi:hypothetical protein